MWGGEVYLIATLKNTRPGVSSIGVPQTRVQPPPQFTNTLLWISSIVHFRKQTTIIKLESTTETSYMRGGPLEVITRLLAVPIVMVPAKTTVVTDDRSQAITTITDYGGELLQGIAIATTPLTDSHGSPATTITVQIHTGTMVVETLTNPKNGEPTTAVILFPLVPNIPGSILANIVVTTSTIYFLVIFSPFFSPPFFSFPFKLLM